MIQANPTEFHREILLRYFRRRARKRFAGIVGRGIERLAPWGRDGNATGPLVIVANHSSWWDAVLPMLISLGHLRHDVYAMMDERQLRRYRFFARAGTFSVDTENPRRAMDTLSYAANLLRDRNRVLWAFPQGVIVPNDARPIVCRSGTARLAAMLGTCHLAPVAFRYEMLDDELPTAYVSVGEPWSVGESDATPIREITARIAARLTAEADHLRHSVLTRDDEGFRMLLEGRPSINERWDRIRRK